MNNWTTDQATTFSWAFWIVLIGVGSLYLLIQHLRTPRNTGNADLQSSVDELSKMPHTGLSHPEKVRKPRKKVGHKILAKPPTPVPFDAKNREHLVALAMLMQGKSRLHPTVRFDYDSSKYDNAYSAALCSLAEQTIPFAVRTEAEALATRPRRIRKKTARSRPVVATSNDLPVKTRVG